MKAAPPPQSHHVLVQCLLLLHLLLEQARGQNLLALYPDGVASTRGALVVGFLLRHQT